MDSVLWTLERGAKTAGMMETLGTNPRAMFASLRDELMQANRADPLTVQALRSAEFDRLMDAADGAVEMRQTDMIAIEVEMRATINCVVAAAACPGAGRFLRTPLRRPRESGA